MNPLLSCVLSLALAAASIVPATLRANTSVEVVRVPNGGIQPEIAVDGAGVIHMVYLAGDAASSNVWYVRSPDGGRSFSRPIRVNSREGSAIATGTIRGAQLAVAPGGRVHIAWNGSNQGGQGMPMLYARSDRAGRTFEPERNLMTRTTTLDGGGSIAADASGVYVAWHANAAGGPTGEAARRVWIARSTDEGATFGEEVPVSDAITGVCGCCGLRLAAAPGGELHLLYRSATNLTQRDIYALVSRDGGRTFGTTRLHRWEIGACPMSSMSIVANESRVLRAWETDGQVYFGPAGGTPEAAIPAPGTAGELARRKHPRMALGRDGALLLVWTEGTSWGRGGSVAWQEFTPDGRPTAVSGTRDGLPAWSAAAVAPRPDGGFVVFY